MEKQSLTRKTIRATILGSIVFGLTALFIGLSIYGSGLINQYVTRAFETARQASGSATMGADSVALSRQVMEIYRSLTPEQRQAEDYLDHYSGIDTRLQSGSDYDVLYHMIRGYIIEVDDVYIGMYDLDTRALVYVVDALNLYADEDPEAVLSGVRRAVDAFVGETEQFDDITMPA